MELAAPARIIQEIWTRSTPIANSSKPTCSGCFIARRYLTIADGNPDLDPGRQHRPNERRLKVLVSPGYKFTRMQRGWLPPASRAPIADHARAIRNPGPMIEKHQQLISALRGSLCGAWARGYLRKNRRSVWTIPLGKKCARCLRSRREPISLDALGEEADPIGRLHRRPCGRFSGGGAAEAVST